MTSILANPTLVRTESMGSKPRDIEGIQELTLEEMDQVHGGFGPTGAVVGAVIAGGGVALNGGNAGQVVAAAIFGGVSGFFGAVGMPASAIAVGLMGAYATGRPVSTRMTHVQH